MAYVKGANDDGLQPGQGTVVNAGDQPGRPLQRGWYLLCHRRYVHPLGRPSLRRHARRRRRDLPVAQCPFLCARWSRPRTTGSSERQVVSRAGHERQNRNRDLRRGLQPK